MNNEIVKVTLRCPIRTTIELVGGKWKLLILFQLSNQSFRLSDLKRQIPDISEKMLIQELKTLIDSDLIKREYSEDSPQRVEYKITDIGLKVLPLIGEMKNFADAYEQYQKR